MLLAAPVIACAAPTRTPRDALPGEQVLRVASYNVNYGLAGDPSTLAAVFASRADVICLQETTPRWEAHLRKAAKGRYPHLWFHTGRGAGGMAVLSKHPIGSAEAHPVTDPGWFAAGQVIVDVAGRDVQLMVLHLRPPVSDSGSFVVGFFESDDVHRHEIASHFEHLHPELPTVVLGDFNEDADGDAIEWLEEKGFTNTLPLFDPDADTWRWKTRLMMLEDDLDHILVDRRFEPIRARVDRIGRSDHLPVVADLVLKPAPAEKKPAPAEK